MPWMLVCRRHLLVLALMIGSCQWSADSSVVFAATRTTALTVRAEMRPQTSLRVSTSLLRFDVPAAGTLDRRQITVEFTAAARTERAGEVVVTVEPAGPMEGPGGAADVEDTVSFSGDSDGTLSGVVTPGGMQVAARWTGSGVRHGRLVFTLSGSAQAGSYVLPVRFLLITP